MKQLEIRINARNNLLIQARLELGYSTQVSASHFIGITNVQLNGYECFRETPVGKNGNWNPLAIRIAGAYGVEPEDLWPKALKEIKRPELVAYADIAELAPGTLPLSLPADTRVDDREMRDVIDRLLSKLPPRYGRTIRARLGFDGKEPMALNELAKEMGVSRERVRQMFNVGVAKLRKADGESLDCLSEWYNDDRYGERTAGQPSGEILV